MFPVIFNHNLAKRERFDIYKLVENLKRQSAEPSIISQDLVGVN